MNYWIVLARPLGRALPAAFGAAVLAVAVTPALAQQQPPKPAPVLKPQPQPEPEPEPVPSLANLPPTAAD